MKDFHQQKLVLNSFLFFVLAVCAFSGSFVEGVDDSTVSLYRATIISASLLFLVVFAACTPGFLIKSSKVFWFVFILASYGFLVAVYSDTVVSALSTYFRLMVFALASEVVRRICLEDREFLVRLSWLFSALVFVSVVIVVQEYLSGETQFLNGALRHDANLSSPIGFSAYIFALFVGLLFFWLRFESLSLFVISLFALALIFLSGTRSVSVASGAFLLFAIVLKRDPVSKVFVSLPLTVFGVAFMYKAGMLDSVVNRVTSLAGGSLDASGSFRMYILETYFSNATVSEVLFGLGLGGFYGWFEVQTGVPDVAPHFEFLWLVSEFGLIGAFVYALCALSFFVFGASRLLGESMRPYLFLLTAVVFGHMSTLQLANPFYFYQFVLVYGILMGILLANERIGLNIWPPFVSASSPGAQAR
ncbi:O-antigen ligase family protein [Marinobacter adhaerens]|uniref:O-antigen ligase family protein n=1 Tax=Marinobacter adhaerens TaxID=1033846 RepID=UPI001E654D32|nr:O-antigen ligase family protein [Marinobacter adhaerens]MCD1648057.1 O-antigen ligase family protein [Marinobacter adhaerens]